MAATATDDEILQVWETFKKLTKDSPDYESLRNRLIHAIGSL
jgi:RNA polymerase sigma factor FliA